MNFEIVRSGIMILTRREKSNVADADVAVG
jgi:hypothetical protein